MEKFVEVCTQGSKSVDREEQVRIVQRLLEREELDPEKRDKNGFCPIHYAAQYGRLEIVDFLLRHCDPHLVTRGSKLTALHVACANNRLDVVQTLLQHCQNGAPPKQDKDGNTPLHLACKIGSLEITNRLLGKYPTSSIYEANKRGITPLGYAMGGNHSAVARHLLSLSSGNPARKFDDFRQRFPSFKHQQSLDHPVSIFVLGNRRAGKSTLIKSVQVEGYLNRTLGVIINTPGVDHHYGGVVPSDVSSYGYGRVKFYELAGCRQSTQENIFLSLAKPAHTLFLIVLSFKDERKEMEANLLFWLSFIHHQYRSIAIKPCVAVVGSFLFYQKLGAIRLDNKTRLRLVYHRVLSSHSELCSHFHFLGKYSMDCRKCESPGLRQLRSVLARKCHEVRPSGGEKNVPSSCYVLFSVLHDIRPPTTGIPALNLSEIEQHISQSASKGQPCSLLSLLPASAEDLNPLLETLEERKAIVTIKHLDPRDPCVIYDEYELLSQIDSSLVQRSIRVSQTSHFNPAIMHVEKLRECLSAVSLSKEVLLNILHRFKISEYLSHGNSPKYFLPSVLHITHYPDHPLTWEPDDPNYSFGFAWCIVPQSNQIAPFFMPRFLYFMLYELFTSTEGEEIDKVVMSESSLFCKQATELEVYITIDSSMVNLHMRCKKGEEVACLKYRNMFLAAIHQQRELLQPDLKVNEYIIPMEVVQFPIEKLRHIKEHGQHVSVLKNAIVTTGSNENMQNELCFEPFIWCNNLSEANLRRLLDPRRTNASVSKEFLQDLSQQIGEKWEVVANSTDLLQVDSDVNTSAEEPDEEESGTKSQIQDPQLPQYGQILEFFSTMSLFRSTSQFVSALKNPQQFNSTSVTHGSQDELDESEAAEDPHPAFPVARLQAESANELQVSSTSPSVSTNSREQAYTPSPRFRNRVTHQPLDLMTCSSTSEVSDTVSQQSIHANVPTIEAERFTYSSNPALYNMQFITTERIQCGTDGGIFQHKYGIGFYIPPGAVSGASHLSLEFGVAVTGPFTYPQNIMPVSPVLWVRIKFENGQHDLKKPIEISIPHAVSGNVGSGLLHFFCFKKKANQVSFQGMHKRAIITPNKGVLLTKLSKQQYFLCIGSRLCEEVIAKTQYCILKVAPKCTIDSVWKVHFFVTYAMSACTEMVKQAYGNNHTVNECIFYFDTSGRGKPNVTLDFPRILPEKWTMMKEGTYQQIEPSHVDFGGMNMQTGVMNIYTYPPKFTIVVDGQRATKDSLAVFQFKGTAPTGLVYEIPLTCDFLPHRRRISKCSSVSMEVVNEEEPPSTVQHTESIASGHSGPGYNSGYDRPHTKGADPPKSPSLTSSMSGYSVTALTGYGTKHTEVERKFATNILRSSISIILKNMDQKIIRPVLYEHRALTDDEYRKLLSLPPSVCNEHIFLMIKQKGVTGFQKFKKALQETVHDCPGHQDILDRLEQDPTTSLNSEHC